MGTVTDNYIPRQTVFRTHNVKIINVHKHTGN